MDNDFNYDKSKQTKIQFRKFYDQKNIYFDNKNLSKDKIKKFNYKETYEIEEDIKIDESIILSNLIDEKYNGSKISEYKNKEDLEIKKNFSRKFLNNDEKKHKNNDNYIEENNLVVNIPNKTISQLKLEKQNIEFKYLNRKNINNFINNKEDYSKINNLKEGCLSESFYSQQANASKKYKILDKKFEVNLGSFNFQADLNLEILNRIKKIEEKENLREKIENKNCSINNKIFIKQTNKGEISSEVEEDYYQKESEFEFKNIDSNESDDYENRVKLEGNNFIFKKNYFEKKKNDGFKENTVITLKKDNLNKLNKIKILLSQKFLNIIVSILSSKLKKYLLTLFENAKYLKIKKLGYNIGENNTVIQSKILLLLLN